MDIPQGLTDNEYNILSLYILTCKRKHSLLTLAVTKDDLIETARTSADQGFDANYTGLLTRRWMMYGLLPVNTLIGKGYLERDKRSSTSKWQGTKRLKDLADNIS